MMMNKRIPDKITAWLTLCCLCLGMAAPLLSHLLAQTAKPGWAEICTSNGIQRIAADGVTKAPTMPNAGAHCPFCLPQHAMPAIPSAVHCAGLPLAQAQIHALPRKRQEAPVRWIWRAHPSRAPPVIF